MLDRLAPCLICLLLPLKAAERITYDDHVSPIFQQACLNCHNPDKTKGGLDLSNYSATIRGGSGGAIAAPGDNSSILLALVRHQAEPKMPPEGDKLDQASIRLLQAWIEGGLLENSSSRARKAQNKSPDFRLSEQSNHKPDGPPPMPEDLLLEPVAVTEQAPSVSALAVSPWSPLLAVTGYRQVLLYHTESLELLGVLPFPEGQPCSLSFHPAGTHLIVGGGVAGKSGSTTTFDIRTGQRVLEVGREFDAVLACDIRPDFKLIATGGPSRMLKLWDVESGEARHSVKKHTDWITAMDISPDGVLLASGDRGGGVMVWETGSAAEFHTLRAHQAAITAVAFRGDSNVLATASADGTVRLWEMNNGTELRKLDAHPGGVSALAFEADGSLVSTGRDRSAKRWKPNFQPDRVVAAKLPSLSTAIASHAASKRAFIGMANGSVQVVSTESGKTLGTLDSNPPGIETRIARLRQTLESEKKENPKIEWELAHWIAASINTRRLDATSRLFTSDLAISEQQERSAEAYQSIDDHTHALAAKRGELACFQKSARMQTASPEIQAEYHATRAAIEHRRKAMARELDEAVSHWLSERVRLEEQFAAHFRIQHDIDALTRDYRAALPPKAAKTQVRTPRP